MRLSHPTLPLVFREKMDSTVAAMTLQIQVIPLAQSLLFNYAVLQSSLSELVDVR